jgi:hypothetical protein
VLGNSSAAASTDDSDSEIQVAGLDSNTVCVEDLRGIEALVRGHGRDIPGETIARHITWTSLGGETRLIKNLPVSAEATPHDLMFRLSLATNRQELDAKHVIFDPEEWQKEEKIALKFRFDRPSLRELKKVSKEEFLARFNPRVPIFVETDGACAGNEGKMCRGGW